MMASGMPSSSDDIAGTTEQQLPGRSEQPDVQSECGSDTAVAARPLSAQRKALQNRSAKIRLVNEDVQSKLAGLADVMSGISIPKRMEDVQATATSSTTAHAEDGIEAQRTTNDVAPLTADATVNIPLLPRGQVLRIDVRMCPCNARVWRANEPARFSAHGAIHSTWG
jgi:hypothetical protein